LGCKNHQKSTKVNPDQHTCAPRRPPARATPTPETKSEKQDNTALRASSSCASCRLQKEKWPLNQGTVRRASPSCASRPRPKPNRLHQKERRVAPDASARRAKGRT
ncbi:hypothetical protein A2U01_0045268, partial [Trifolium medium]|nr:hypothetical protein [Trifolium medium]